jgi:predicted RNA-binding Zn-ribbon protein involved in translation (DUF1610 family)
MHCIHCEYNLSATARDSAGDWLCPECGQRTSVDDITRDEAGRRAVVRGVVAHFVVLVILPSVGRIVMWGLGHAATWFSGLDQVISLLQMPLIVAWICWLVFGPIIVIVWMIEKLFAARRRELRRWLIAAVGLGHVPAVVLGTMLMLLLMALLA